MDSRSSGVLPPALARIASESNRTLAYNIKTGKIQTHYLSNRDWQALKDMAGADPAQYQATKFNDLNAILRVEPDGRLTLFIEEP